MLDPLDITPPDRVPVRRALLSVSDKTGLAELATALHEQGAELVSTGGTAKVIADAGLPVVAVDDVTGFPEMMDGRVKTLHPRLFAGILGVRDLDAHAAAATEHEIGWIDLVVVNLYPFEDTIAREGVTLAEAIENIDIGGPSLIRAAAKNHAYATILTDPAQYGAVIEELRASGDGSLGLDTRRTLALQAYATTARYDAAISGFLQEQEAFGGTDTAEDGTALPGFPPTFSRGYVKDRDLRYGENPHQRAAYYRRAGSRAHLLSGVHQLHGKELSFNNLLDLEASRAIARELADDPAAVIVKHNNPCGAAIGDSSLQAFERALASDPVSAFGGIVTLTRPVDKAAAEALSQLFVEVLFAPSYDEDALSILTQKPNVRLLQGDDAPLRGLERLDVRPVAGGALVQDADGVVVDRAGMSIATEAQPTDEQWRDLLFAWRVMRHVKSNAIVYAKDGATVGIGAGQMSRVDSARIGVEKATEHGLDLTGAAMASDAFFPFPDGLQIGLDAGVRAVIQPGGSMRDELSIDAANAAGAAMVLTGRRHFRH
ncbi:bifunctional phosphoribosylaminoimidazolecarboxamide formyltransferase/IMP cyclohydrolase [Patulibacter brassicae]|jgi:phosphoribosylaminoimidazolecarboxamide formyltransferase/IMP cyclohydrolase|uniref:Bifunctional purine biosynthesis protein PurH n=1 Tax=Patulibacter brassicae TaxID=1705717 RepID=A0ABU4VLL7_9ACTN|nr:bifunctional phosphoribosylaminoimidazolecarboxamide formyltransferase/IMP cyclohydrolase [Patulibacter brassicae]MDX8151831.1 bifunctional phosphoribosylaminoimidazolecarboxamide formyltransferase/IMP cyclohydrolase [Patulibacter brassicae]